jgi:hypothetical protein
MKNIIDRKKACPMKSILEELYYGHIHPFEQIVHQDPDYPLNRKIYDLKLALQEKLPAEDIQALEDLVDLCCDSGVQESAASFEYGFKLGALMMMEVLGGKKELTDGKDKLYELG